MSDLQRSPFHCHCSPLHRLFIFHTSQEVSDLQAERRRLLDALEAVETRLGDRQRALSAAVQERDAFVAANENVLRSLIAQVRRERAGEYNCAGEGTCCEGNECNGKGAQPPPYCTHPSPSSRALPTHPHPSPSPPSPTTPPHPPSPLPFPTPALPRPHPPRSTKPWLPRRRTTMPSVKPSNTARRLCRRPCPRSRGPRRGGGGACGRGCCRRQRCVGVWVVVVVVERVWVVN